MARNRFLFEDVFECVDIADFNRFLRRFCRDWKLSSSEGVRVGFALCYVWMDVRPERGRRF